MATKTAKAKVPAPAWFDLARYEEAADLDAAGWLLNLKLRGWLHRERDPEGERIVRQWPIVRRDNDGGSALSWLALSRRRAWQGDQLAFVDDLLWPQHGLMAGIEPMTVAEFYTLERMLPKDVREFGAGAYLRQSRSLNDPSAYYGRLDHALSQQFTRRRVSVDMAEPDDVLVEDFKRFLERERADLARLPGAQPYRDAIRVVSKTKAFSLQTLHNVGLLPFLDLRRSVDGVEMSDYAIAKLIGVSPDRLDEVHKYAAIALDGFAVSALLGPRVRGLPPKSQRRR